ncbi:hypothetical protein CL634_06775 [bacterium]|nr:hypothetical protein [bacterium]
MKRDQLKEYFRRYYSGTLLTEQDEEEGTDDLFGGEDEGGDEGGEETADIEADADDEAADDAGDTETEVEEVNIEPEDEVRLGKQLDQAIDSILTDFDVDAQKTAVIDADYQEELDTQVEWWKRPISNILFEQDEEAPAPEATKESEIDIDKFAGDVAHLIKNYDVLLDMEDIIFKKAYAFLEEKYDDVVAAAFEEAILQSHDLDFSSQSVEMQDSIEVPLAVGAGGGEGGGGGV